VGTELEERNPRADPSRLRINRDAGATGGVADLKFGHYTG
jgi:hypothetical protein